MADDADAGAENTLFVATFFLDDAVFGIDSAYVQEVVRVGAITAVHHAPEFVMGVMNLRGRIVTLIDLRVKFGLDRVEPGVESRFFILEWQGEPVGLLVDRVSDAVTLNLETVRPVPENLSTVQHHYLRGVCQVPGHLVALLDLDAVLGLAQETAQGPTERG